MINYRNARFVILSILSLMLLFGACSNTSEPEQPRETKLTEAQAEALLEENALLVAQLAFFLRDDLTSAADGDVDDIRNIGGVTPYGDVRFLNKFPKISTLKKPVYTDTVYYKGGGCWVIELQDENDYLSADVNGEICFGSYNEIGHPLESNNVLDIMLDAGFIMDSPLEEGYSSHIEFKILKDFNMSGINDYKAEDGPAIFNGSESEEIKVNYVTPEESFSGTVKITFTVKEIKIENGGDYPENGSFDFSFSASSEQSDELADNYFVTGGVAFDGTAIADVTLGGYNFTIDLSEYDYYN